MFLLKTLFSIPHNIQTRDGRNPLKTLSYTTENSAAGICLKRHEICRESGNI